MSDDTRYVQDWSRSYLLEQYTKSEIKWNQAETRIEINDSDINKYYEKINKLYMNIEYDDNWKMIITDKNRPIKEAIDRLYNECDDNTWKKIAEILTELEILPEWWENDDDVLKMCKKIAENLKNNKKRCEKLWNMKTVKDNLYKEKLKLQQKDDKTEEDKKTIRLLEDFEKNPTEYEQYCKSYIGMIQEWFLYGWINDLVSQSLTSVFADKWWWAKESWAKWHAWKLYNEMTWQWLLNFSDNTHKRIYWLCDDAINNAVVTLITLWIAEAISATWLATSISAKFSNAAANIIAKLKSMLPTRAINALKKAKDFLLKIWTRAKDSAPKVMNYTTEAFKKFPDLKKFTRDAFLKNIREWKQNPFEGITVQWYISSYVQSVTMWYINWLTGIAGWKIWDLVNKYWDDFFQKCWDFLERNQYLKEYLEAIDPKAMEEWIKWIIEKKVKNYFEEKWKEIWNKIHNDLLKINLNIWETINFNFKMDWLSRFLDDTSMIEIAKYRLNQDLRFKISNQSKKPNALDIFNFIESLIYINRDKPRFVSSLIEGLNKWKKEISFWENWDIYAINTETWSKNTLEELFNSAA